MKKIFNKSLFKLLFVFITFLISSNITNAAVTNTITVTPAKPTVTIKYGGSATITFSVTGSYTRCYLGTDPANADANAVTPGAPGFNVSPTVTTTYTITCDDYTATPLCNSYTVPLNTCFIADTKVLLSDGSSKNIQDVNIGDMLKGETTNNRVLGFHDPKLEDGKLYSFNGGRYFVTAEHPFKTTDGWKSINPKKTLVENIGVTVTELKVGDTLITENGNVILRTIDSKNDKASTQLYNFKLDGDHTYYADGYLVHNKMACGGGYACGSGSICIGPDGYPADTSGTGGTCKACPGTITCQSGYTSSCSGGFVVCTQTTGCSGTVSIPCQGTVIGSSQNGTSPGPYEGDSCSIFTTSATCLQGAVTHGCSWNTGSLL